MWKENFSSFFLVLVRTRKSTFSAFYKRKEILVSRTSLGTQKVAWQANDWTGLVNALLFEANVCFVEIVQNANSAHWTVSRIRFCVFATVAVLLEKGQRKIAAKICLSPGSRSWFVSFNSLVYQKSWWKMIEPLRPRVYNWGMSNMYWLISIRKATYLECFCFCFCSRSNTQFSLLLFCFSLKHSESSRIVFFERTFLL